MKASSAANLVAALASQYRQPDNALSFDALREAAWRESGGVAVAERDLTEVFAAQPDLIDAWCDLSDDQRSGDAWFFRREPRTEGGRRWIIGSASTGDELAFTDRANACAAFVARMLGEPFAVCTSLRDGS